jgi:hypothetical protein
MSIEITVELLDDLHGKAKSATPGPWDRQGLANLLRFGHKHDGPWDECESDCYLPLPEENDAEFISAANPDVILALINKIRELTEANQILDSKANRLRNRSFSLKHSICDLIDTAFKREGSV